MRANEGFKFNAYTITDPSYDVTGRFEVDPFEYYGAPFIEWLKELLGVGTAESLRKVCEHVLLNYVDTHSEMRKLRSKVWKLEDRVTELERKP